MLPVEEILGWNVEKSHGTFAFSFTLNKQEKGILVLASKRLNSVLLFRQCFAHLVAAPSSRCCWCFFSLPFCSPVLWPLRSLFVFRFANARLFHWSCGVGSGPQRVQHKRTSSVAFLRKNAFHLFRWDTSPPSSHSRASCGSPEIDREIVFSTKNDSPNN